MTRNLKALGLALIAVCAMSAFAASSSQAATKATCASYPCVITAETIEHPEIGKKHTFTIGKKVLSCTTVIGDATIEKEAKNEVVTVTPTYSGCTAEPGALPITVTMNGCDYELSGGEEDKEDHFIKGTTKIVCPEGKKIETHLYATASEHTAGKSLCTETIPAQTILNSNTFTNTTGTLDDVDLSTTATVAVEVDGGKVLCGEEKQNTVYTGSTTLRAYVDKGNCTNANGETVYTEGEQIKFTISK